MEPKDYVLQDMGEAEREMMQEVYQRVIAAVETLVCEGITEAMNQHNAPPE
jgi:peptidyl-tRNA hydrolase